MDAARQIADAVLYEGYILWPYRRSALKNTRRWTFGGVFPPAHSERHPDDRARMRTEFLVEGGREATLDVHVRFLHVVRRRAMSARPGEQLEPADQVTVDGVRHLSWEEAAEHELRVGGLALGELTAAPRRAALSVAPGSEREILRESDSPRGPTAAIVRDWLGLDGHVDVAAEELGPGRYRLSIEIANDTPFGSGTREQALERTLCSTHAVVDARGARLVSLADPPPELRDEARACRNEGAWPVLLGDPGERHTLLCSPIILEDHPRIAPESPGDLFDGGEIDQLLTLNILTLTDAEKAEMRDSDPRTREILERTESLTEEELMRLHGTIRDLRQVR